MFFFPLTMAAQPWHHVQRMTQGATLAVALLFAAPLLAQAAGEGASSEKYDGVAVPVTPVMIGAGAVSSGVKLPPIPPVSGSRQRPVASWGKPLPYPILLADRRNNRLIEIAPDKRIVWEFDTPSLKIYRGNEDVNFSPDGKQLAVSEEDNFDVHLVDYESRTLTWTYGVPDTRGKSNGLLNYPDDAHLLSDGKFLTADIRNCRVLIIDPADNSISTQWGTPGKCNHKPPQQLSHPNGATPMENGDILITEIGDSQLSRFTRAGEVVWSYKVPHLHYPSDAFPTVDGKQVIVADFWKPGRVLIFDPATQQITWEYVIASGDRVLDHPSIARELPDTGDILIVDDLNDRVMVIDRQTKEVIWEYGQKGKKGYLPGLLHYPDGVDIDVFRDWKNAR
jgi:DNA-binding beta-propeller fold protein YncE